MTTTAKAIQPPFGICEACLQSQKFHALDVGHGVFYCKHTQTIAMAKQDGTGFLLETGISEAEHTRRIESAAVTIEMMQAPANKSFN